MKNFAFVFARGGSKGLSGKNIKPLAGKPLIQYSIETAKKCPSIDEVFVSTDDAAIADIAREAGGVNPGEHHVRMALVATVEECVEAAERIKTFLTKG